MTASSPRILVIRRRYLGDIVLLGSVFKNLRLHWPKAQVALLAERAYAPVGALHPELNRVRSFPTKFTQWPRFIREIRRTHFTHVLDFDNSDKTAFVTRLSGAPVRITYEREGSLLRQAWAYTKTSKVSAQEYESQHITETYLNLLTEISVPITTREVRLCPRNDDLARTQRFAPPTFSFAPKTTASRPRILLHPGSRSRFRMWPTDRFAAVCDALQESADAQVFLVAGPGERSTAREIRDKARTHLILIDEALSVGEFAALCSRFDLMLCHDSGPMHIAAAVGTRVVALFGSQNAQIWVPCGAGHRALQTELPCTCLSHTPTLCVREDSYRNYCVRKLSVESVLAAIRATLHERNL